MDYENISIYVLGIAVGIYKFLEWLKAKKVEKLKAKKKRIDWVNSVNVNNHIVSSQAMLRAERGNLFSFHNGGDFQDGRGMLKFSCDLESLKSGVSSLLPEFKEKLQSHFISIILPIKENIKDTIEIFIDEMPECPFKNIMIKHAVHKFYIKAVVKDKEAVGFILMTYTENNEYKSMLSIKQDMIKLSKLIEAEFNKDNTSLDMQVIKQVSESDIK